MVVATVLLTNKALLSVSTRSPSASSLSPIGHDHHALLGLQEAFYPVQGGPQTRGRDHLLPGLVDVVSQLIRHGAAPLCAQMW